MNTIPLQLVPDPMPERETIGQRIQRARSELGYTRKQLAARVKEIGGLEAPSESFIRDLEQDRFPSPGIKGLEFVALALDLQPLELIALGLSGEYGESSAARDFMRTRFGRLWKLYEQTDSKRLRAVVEETIQMLVDRLNKG